MAPSLPIYIYIYIHIYIYKYKTIYIYIYIYHNLYLRRYYVIYGYGNVAPYVCTCMYVYIYIYIYYTLLYVYILYIYIYIYILSFLIHRIICVALGTHRHDRLLGPKDLKPESSAALHQTPYWPQDRRRYITIYSPISRQAECQH